MKKKLINILSLSVAIISITLCLSSYLLLNKTKQEQLATDRTLNTLNTEYKECISK